MEPKNIPMIPGMKKQWKLTVFDSNGEVGSPDIALSWSDMKDFITGVLMGDPDVEALVITRAKTLAEIVESLGPKKDPSSEEKGP